MNSNKHIPIICFRRWSRKGYAVFASLNKVVKIGVVTFGCTLVQQEYQTVFAQSDSTAQTLEVNLDEVEITENALKLGSGLARTTSMTDQREISASPLHSIDDILKQVAGVDIRQRGTDGVQSDISIRGGSFDQVMILLNGVNITDPQTGHYNLDIPANLQQIQRIEVLQGAGARVWGPNAFSGAINLVTLPGSSAPVNKGILELSAGSYGYKNLSASGYQQKGFWTWSGSVSQKQSDGYRANTDYQLFNSNMLSSYKNPLIGTVQLQLGYQQKAFGANSFYTFSYPNQFERTKTLFSALNWEKTVGQTSWQAQVYERRHHDRFELFRNMENKANWYTGHNYHQTDASGGNLKVIQLSKLGKTTLGAEVRNEHIYSNVLGEPMKKNKTDLFDKDALFNKEKNRINHRFFADHTLFLNQMSLSAGLSGNFNSDYGTYFNGGIDVEYQVNNHLKTYVNFNQATRLPTFTDLYYKNATQISNPNLKPELSNTYEWGLNYSSHGFRTYLSAYYRIGKNVIDWVKVPDSTKWESRNLTSVNAFGGELKTEYLFEKGFIQKISFSCSLLQLDKQANGFDSKYALDYLKQKLNLHLEHRLFDCPIAGSLRGVWNVSWQNRGGNYTDFRTKQITDYRAYEQTDFRLYWKKKDLGVYVDANNLFNTLYADFGGLIQPGRTIRLGLTYRF